MGPPWRNLGRNRRSQESASVDGTSDNSRRRAPDNAIYRGVDGSSPYILPPQLNHFVIPNPFQSSPDSFQPDRGSIQSWQFARPVSIGTDGPDASASNEVRDGLRNNFNYTYAEDNEDDLRDWYAWGRPSGRTNSRAPHERKLTAFGGRPEKLWPVREAAEKFYQEGVNESMEVKPLLETDHQGRHWSVESATVGIQLGFVGNKLSFSTGLSKTGGGSIVRAPANVRNALRLIQETRATVDYAEDREGVEEAAILVIDPENSRCQLMTIGTALWYMLLYNTQKKSIPLLQPAYEKWFEQCGNRKAAVRFLYDRAPIEGGFRRNITSLANMIYNRAPLNTFRHDQDVMVAGVCARSIAVNREPTYHTMEFRRDAEAAQSPGRRFSWFKLFSEPIRVMFGAGWICRNLLGEEGPDQVRYHYPLGIHPRSAYSLFNSWRSCIGTGIRVPQFLVEGNLLVLSLGDPTQGRIVSQVIPVASVSQETNPRLFEVLRGIQHACVFSTQVPSYEMIMATGYVWIR